MTESPSHQSALLDELDRRQNDVIQRLDELNLEIENTLKSWSHADANPEQGGNPECSEEPQNV